jgi:hypothetical protein
MKIIICLLESLRDFVRVCRCTLSGKTRDFDEPEFAVCQIQPNPAGNVH